MLVAGAVFAARYFPDNVEIVSLAGELEESVDWTIPMGCDCGSGIYMCVYDNGTGYYITEMFDEYSIVAWLAYRQEIRLGSSGAATLYWNKYLNPDTLFKSIPRTVYDGVNLLANGDELDDYISSWIVQFPYFFTDDLMGSSDLYLDYIRNASIADRKWFRTNYPDAEESRWGLGAGPVPGDKVHYNSLHSPTELTHCIITTTP